ncbi:DUF1559 domain-containing protein [Gimesia maris]|uniref:DUF1559 family PulG-like putative transporter n=1 Tax=Gimesia maris TaxID=122 RepID=UPI0030D99290|tara:strand:- start:1315 stop:2088 length:774 start_codon:yes stop_codon:yes gene_type:complete
MNTNSQQTLVQPAKPDNFTPSASTFFIILAGCLFAVGLMIFLFTPVFEKMEIHKRNLARRAVSKSNLKQMGLALAFYHEENQTFPPGATVAPNGTPQHSWQTSLLPFMDQSGLFEQINFEKPWNDPVNQQHFQQIVRSYVVPWSEEKISPEGYALSHYVGNELLLKQNQGMPLSQITDGASNTIMAVDRGNDFKAWGDPTNLARPADIIGPDKKTLLPGGNLILFSDGRVQFVSNKIDSQILKDLSTPDGGEAKCDL